MSVSDQNFLTSFYVRHRVKMYVKLSDIRAVARGNFNWGNVNTVKFSSYTVGILQYLTLPLQKRKLRKRTEASASICLILAMALVMRSVFHIAYYKIHGEK